MNNRDQFAKDFIEEGKNRGKSKEEIIKKLDIALIKWDQDNSDNSEFKSKVDDFTKVLPGVGLEKTLLNKIGIQPERALNLTSNLAGGYLSGQDTQDKSLMGAAKRTLPLLSAPDMISGVTENKSVMEELPRSMGIDPNSPAGLGVGFLGEIATPDPLDLIVWGKASKKVAQKDLLPDLPDNS